MHCVTAISYFRKSLISGIANGKDASRNLTFKGIFNHFRRVLSTLINIEFFNVYHI
ncbi:hypothetical protein NIES2100_74620 [Calothrix sp. NIES-2100]|nr:hypothetical protein NIES2100_74620 [Calothrix sp. NIES-2100]